MPNFRRNLAVKVETPGGDNPLLLFFVSPEGTPPFYRGVPLSGVALKGKGGTPAYAYSIVAGSLPTGLSLNGITGAITGTPTVPGHFTFVARVQDFAANIFLKSFSIDVKSPLFVVAGTPRPGEVTLPYSYQFIVADATGFRLTSGYSVVAGTIPAGLTFHSNGILDGTPTAPDGTSYFTVQATDGTDTIRFEVSVLIYAQLSVTIVENFLGLDVSIAEIPPVKRNTPYIAHAVRTGGSPTGRFRQVVQTSFGPDPFPVGIKIDSNSGLISGQTSEAATPIMSPLLVPVIGVSFTDSLGGYAEAFFHQRVVNTASSTRVLGSGGTNPINDAGTLSFTSGDGSVTYSFTVDGEIDIRATGGSPGGSGISTINGINPTSNGDFQIVSDGSISIVENSNGELEISVVGGGSGTVTSFSAGNLSPLFTSSVATATTTPALTFAQVNQNANLIFAGPATGAAAAPTFRTLVVADIPALSYHVQIQFQDEGSNLGATGTATIVNFTGAGVTATRVSNTVTVDVPGGVVNLRHVYGSGQEGNVTLDGVLTYGSLGINLAGTEYTLGRALSLDNLTITGSASLLLNGSHLLVKNTLDASGTSAPIAIAESGSNKDAANASSSSGSAPGAPNARRTLGIGGTGLIGRAGGTAAGTAATGSVANVFPTLGGAGGQAGRGGAGSGGAGGAAGTAGDNSSFYVGPYEQASWQINGINSAGTGINYSGAGAGGGGAGGGGDGTAGGGGGGGGAGGSITYVAARVVVKRSSGVLLSAKGGRGGNGFSPAAGNRGGGGGGPGGGGGNAQLVYESLTGSGSVIVDASGGDGGTGGTKSGTGINGSGGGGGTGGQAVTICTATGVLTRAQGTAIGLACAAVGVTTAVPGESVQVTL